MAQASACGPILKTGTAPSITFFSPPNMPTDNHNSARPARIAVLALLLVTFAQTAQAYTDPGSGALLWQMLTAAFVGCLFYLRGFARWLRNRSKRQ